MSPVWKIGEVMGPGGGNTPRFMSQLTSIDFCPYISQTLEDPLKKTTEMFMNILVKFKFTIKDTNNIEGEKCRNVKLSNSCGVRVTPICWAGSVSNPRCSNLAQTKFKCVPESATKFKCQLLQTGEGGCGGEGSCHQTSVRHKFESATCIMFECLSATNVWCNM